MYTLSEAAMILGVTSGTLNNWRVAGSIVCVKAPARGTPGGWSYRVTQQEVDRVLAGRTPPKGWVSTTQAATDRGMSRQYLLRVLRSHKCQVWVPFPQSRTRGGVECYFDPADVARFGHNRIRKNASGHVVSVEPEPVVIGGITVPFHNAVTLAARRAKLVARGAKIFGRKVA